MYAYVSFCSLLHSYNALMIIIIIIVDIIAFVINKTVCKINVILNLVENR